MSIKTAAEILSRCSVKPENCTDKYTDDLLVGEVSVGLHGGSLPTETYDAAGMRLESWTVRLSRPFPQTGFGRGAKLTHAHFTRRIT